MTVREAFQLGLEHYHAGRLAEAEAVYEHLLQQFPNHPELLHALGLVVNKRGLHRRAIELMLPAVVASPGNATFHNNLGEAYRGLKQFDQAIASYRRAIAADANFAEAYNNLALCLAATGAHDDAAEAYEQAIRLKPDFAQAHSNFGALLIRREMPQRAIEHCRSAIAINPDYATAYTNLGQALLKSGALSRIQGDAPLLDDPIACFRKAVLLDENSRAAWDNYLLGMYYDHRLSPAVIAEEHKKWARIFAPGTSTSMPVNLLDRDSRSRLRIGYVSPDFMNHPVGRFLLPLLRNHDHTVIEISCYSDVLGADDLTRQLRDCAHHWHDVAGLSDRELCDLIRSHRIDVLIDLAMHTSGNRLGTFAVRAAPVQVCYLAYPGTTGLPQMDFRITDAFLDPSGDPHTYATEKPMRLPHCFWCYNPHPDTPPPRSARCGVDAPVTFGCLNQFSKVTATTVAAWRTILHQVPDSTLIVAAEGNQGAFRELFQRDGIDPHRIECLPIQNLEGYFRSYHRIDIALDPFPYNGGTTTCDALWMGVPVVTLAGSFGVSRSGVTLLNNAGVPELIAETADQYVQIAIQLAADPARLSGYHKTLRQRVERSPLRDERGLARSMEKLYRQMCEQVGAD